MSLHNVLHGIWIVRRLHLLLMPAALALLVPLVVGYQMYSKSETKERYQKLYGDSWALRYEKEVGPVHEDPTDTAINVGGSIVMLGLAFFVYKMMMPPGPIKPTRSRRSHR